MPYKILLVFEADEADSEAEAEAILDRFRESARPGWHFGVTLSRATPDDARIFGMEPPDEAACFLLGRPVVE